MCDVKSQSKISSMAVESWTLNKMENYLGVSDNSPLYSEFWSESAKYCLLDEIVYILFYEIVDLFNMHIFFVYLNIKFVHKIVVGCAAAVLSSVFCNSKRANERANKRLFLFSSAFFSSAFFSSSFRLLLKYTHRGVIVICFVMQKCCCFVFSSLILNYFHSAFWNLLMACSRRDFNYWRWWWRRWWYDHIFNGTNMILNFNKRLLRIFKTTFSASYRLHIETGFHFDWNIYTN